MEDVKIRNLTPKWGQDAIDYHYKSTFPQLPNSTPECSFRTPWFRCHKALFRIDLTVVRPEGKQPECDLALGRGKTKAILEAVADMVKSFKEELR